MIQEPLPIYKLIVLYMLDRLPHSVSTAQISEFAVEKGYMNFLTLQQVISELSRTGLVEAQKTHNRTQLRITWEGHDTLSYFQDSISRDIRDEIRTYLEENGLRMRNEASVQSDYQKIAEGEFEARLQATDNGTSLVSIRLNVPTEELAMRVCDNWQKHNEEIYRYLTTALL